MQELVWAREIGMQTFAAPAQARLSDSNEGFDGLVGFFSFM